MRTYRGGPLPTKSRLCMWTLPSVFLTNAIVKAVVQGNCITVCRVPRNQKPARCVVGSAVQGVIDKAHLQVLDPIPVDVPPSHNLQFVQPFAWSFKHKRICSGFARLHAEISECAQRRRAARPEGASDTGQVELIREECKKPKDSQIVSTYRNRRRAVTFMNRPQVRRIDASCRKRSATPGVLDSARIRASIMSLKAGDASPLATIPNSCSNPEIWYHIRSSRTARSTAVALRENPSISPSNFAKISNIVSEII